MESHLNASGAVRCGVVRCGAVRCGAVPYQVFQFSVLLTSAKTRSGEASTMAWPVTPLVPSALGHVYTLIPVLLSAQHHSHASRITHHASRITHHALRKSRSRSRSSAGWNTQAGWGT
jgi:hypothetical protein